MKINPVPFSQALVTQSPLCKREVSPDQLTELFYHSVFDKLEAKPKILRQIISLKSEIYKIEKALDNSKEKIEQLKGGQAAKLPLIGTLIKYLFKWYNQNLITKEEYQNQQLHFKEDQVKHDIDKLQKLLPTEEEEKPSVIFAMEYEMRLILDKDFPEKDKYLDLFNNKIRPLIEQTKQSLTHTAHHFVAHAAAAKGKAAQAGFKALKDLAENNPVIKESDVSSQQVFLLPQEGVVFKISSERAKEEEMIVNALLDLMSQEVAIGTFSIHEASVDKFGIKISEEEHLRGFTIGDLSPALRKGIKEKLSKEDLLILKKIEKTPPIADKDLVNYQEMKKKMWYVKQPGQRGELKSFKDLQSLNLSGKLDPMTLIGFSQEHATSLKEHLLAEDGKGSAFAQALHYLPTLQKSPQLLILSPDLSDQEMRKVYLQCEAHMWSYLDDQDTMHQVDFKTLHSLYLQKEIIKDIQAIENHSPYPSSFNLYQALNVNWKTVSPELMQIEYGSLISALSDIEAKPFVKEMILMKKISENVRNVLLNRLTPDAEFNAILTGEVQLLDMYANNLGVAPEPTLAYEQFKNHIFKLPNGIKNFNELILDYLDGKISPTTLIEFEDQGHMICKSLKDLPELQEALNVRWQFVIFDTDLSLTEDNRLQMQTYNNVVEHLIPLRSVLLETTWKDKLLSKETIERLIDSDARDHQVKLWIKKKDAPIYKQLSSTLKKEVEDYVAPFIQKYNLSNPRKNGEDITIKSLSKQFIEEMIDPIDHFEFWHKLEQALSYATVHSDDTWESIAARYEQNISELKSLNSDKLIPGKKIKINYDLTSSFSSAVEKRKRIASQLFPRITNRQQNALIERQKKRREYLFNYQYLTECQSKGLELVEQLQNFIKEPTAPLSSLRKKELLAKLNDQKTELIKSPKNLEALRKEICQECQPTYFNIIKAMYPLIADTYDLNRAIYDTTIAGKYIGLFSQSLEKTIKHVKKTFSPSSQAYQLAQLLQTKIDSISDPAFFGHWEL